jgi:sigma-B regulation protein RsbU (phosphoserine phosphatase)
MRSRNFPTTSRPVLQYLLLAILFIVAVAYQLRLARDILHDERVSIPVAYPGTASAVLDLLSQEAEQAGLHRGDTLVAVNGRPYTGSADPSRVIEQARPGDQIEVTVRPADAPTELRTIVLTAKWATDPWYKTALDFVLLILMPVLCLALGFWVVLVRPRDLNAWLLLGLLLGFTQIIESHKLESWGPGVREWAMVYHSLLAAAWPILMFLFGFYFPEPLPWYERQRRWRRWIPWLVCAPIIIAGGISVAVAVYDLTDYTAAARIYAWLTPWQRGLRFYIYLVVGSFFTFIFLKSSLPGISVDAKRRLRLLYWGSSIAMLPVLGLLISARLAGRQMGEMYPDWLVSGALLLLLIFPLTLAYVIVVQRAMDVSVALRQGLQYALARGGVRVLQATLSLATLYAAVTLITNPSRSHSFKLVIAVLATIGVLRIRQRGDKLRKWVDRKFFREAYDADQVLSELSEQVRNFVETKPLVETVTERISQTLHVPQVAVLLGGSGFYRPAYATGYANLPEIAFPGSTGAAKLLAREKEPAIVYLDDPGSWVYRDSEINQDERERLQSLHSELLLPLNARDKLLGFISLGAKRSEQPYTGTDLRLLKSVAAQTGLALENAELVREIAVEVAQRERLNREVEIAREVQERLFPQTLPTVAGLDYAGFCRPALGVGGDYYDFLALPHGHLGIAIGDVSGKGIAAALMMASLQASLRGEATRGPENLAAAVSNVNRLVYEASASDRYATFFYGQYDPAARRFDYVNAGHNPPMLFRVPPGSSAVDRLDVGGTVVGLLESFPYQQDSVVLHSGDILVAYTDGISEAMNHADEEWGEERLQASVQRCSDMNARQIIDQIFRDADEFVAGAKQHDDMTVVVVCVK